jgi:flagellar hook protein FlgE
MNVSAIASTGLQAAQTRLSVSAHNVANEQTAGFRRQLVQQQTLPGGTVVRVTTAQTPGTDLTSEMVHQKESLYAFKANLKAIQTEHEMLGSLLDDKA